MFTKIKALVVGAVSALFLATGAHAATVDFTVDSVTLTRTGNCADLFCNVDTFGISSIVDVPRTAVSGSSTEIEAFQFRSYLASTAPRGEAIGDTFRVQAVVVLNVAGSLYSYIANGVMSGWRVSETGIVEGGSLVWNTLINSATEPLQVVFGTTLFQQQGGGISVFSRIFVNVAPSVVPLPAGVVLLLTALAGLVGLKRRKLAVA